MERTDAELFSEQKRSMHDGTMFCGKDGWVPGRYCILTVFHDTLNQGSELRFFVPASLERADEVCDLVAGLYREMSSTESYPDRGDERFFRSAFCKARAKVQFE